MFQINGRYLHYLNILLLIFSLLISIYFLLSPDFYILLHSLKSLSYLGVFISGIFFSYILTTGPATISLFLFGQTISPFHVALIASLGATASDFLIFSLIKYKVAHHFGIFDRIKAWLKYRKFFIYIKSHGLLKYLIPLVGALIIASPLPDELGIAILGASKYDNKKFFLLTFAMNALGIFIVASLGAANL